MLHNFLTANRTLLVARCRNMVAERSGATSEGPDLAHGVPIFLGQIIKTLTIAETTGSSWTHGVWNNPAVDADCDVGATAALHGRELFQHGYSLEQVIRDYGDVCQAVTSLAVETGAVISAEEFRMFNHCLDDAIAAAATEYSLHKNALTFDRLLPIVRTFRGADDLEHLEAALTLSRTALAHTEAALSASQRDTHEAQFRALHDSLTGLPNRELFDDRLTHAISLADRHDWTLAVLFLDLDQFKSVNDAHGHAVGDSVLKAIADRLLKHVRNEDTVCRNGGDEFLYLLINPRDQVNVARIAESVVKSIAQPLKLGDFNFVIKPSIGIAIYPDHGSNAKELITNADAAMYCAKRHPRGFMIFKPQAIEHAGPLS
jgi:diguanylate cyclase (GGDEF)-like protein